MEENKGIVSADDALARLMEGNARFLSGAPRNLHTPREVHVDLVKGQRPFATILGCSDSRVPPELIFDVGFGDLFIIRVAGNVISPEVAGSMQYASMHLKTQLVVVLGHEGCGAVQAALARNSMACGNARASLCFSRGCFRALKISIRCYRMSNSSSARSKPTSGGPCARFSSRPKHKRDCPITP
jgi:hypothetical protein